MDEAWKVPGVIGRDIGISPSEIESIVHCAVDRRRRYDANWLWR
jgi:hypothetical protein